MPSVLVSRSAHPACSCTKSSGAASLACAGGEVRRLRELRELALGGLAAVPGRELARTLAQIRADLIAAGGEQAHHLPGDPLDLVPVAVLARHPLQPEPRGQGLFEVLGHDRADGADVLVVAVGVRCPPFPVS